MTTYIYLIYCLIFIIASDNFMYFLISEVLLLSKNTLMLKLSDIDMESKKITLKRNTIYAVKQVVKQAGWTQ